MGFPLDENSTDREKHVHELVSSFLCTKNDKLVCSKMIALRKSYIGNKNATLIVGTDA